MSFKSNERNLLTLLWKGFKWLILVIVYLVDTQCKHFNTFTVPTGTRHQYSFCCCCYISNWWSQYYYYILGSVPDVTNKPTKHLMSDTCDCTAMLLQYITIIKSRWCNHKIMKQPSAGLEINISTHTHRHSQTHTHIQSMGIIMYDKKGKNKTLIQWERGGKQSCYICTNGAAKIYTFVLGKWTKLYIVECLRYLQTSANMPTCK